MLILARYENERIYIGNNITLTVVEIRDGTVRLGFEAPPEIRVDREEVRERRIIEARRAEGMTI